jgi:deoxyribodipyrimidine photo-lyase
MEKRFRRALFIFRRDLRLEDNTGLIFSLKNADEVIPCFIFTPEQIEKNPYRSNHCLQFMIESLEDLEDQLRKQKGKLFLFYEKVEKCVEKCIEKLGVDVVVVNRDYTPYSCRRDQKINSFCKKFKVAFHSFEDLLLHPPEETRKSDGSPYTVFTPFFRNASKLEVSPCTSNRYANYYSRSIPFATDSSLYKQILPKRTKQANGGRKAGLAILKNLKDFSDYKEVRDFPEKNGTTHLSAHLKFTTCSSREVYHAVKQQLGKKSDLIRSLYWRDFFTSIAFYFPKVFKGAFHDNFDRIRWGYKNENFKRWCDGKTGFPIVDAGMREMNQTGFMHNRVRMIVASFLVKDLHIDWRWGEKYFAQTLIDYDPAVNNGNWQWCASTGCDAQPYFRIFNPWSQQAKFDPDCKYIKQWLPELAPVSCKAIHEWYLEENQNPSIGYPIPIVDHAIEAKKTLESYKMAAKR